MNTKLQFRVLYRQFLFRLMDVELLSASAGGDASALLGQFGALLIFGSFLLSIGAIGVSYLVTEPGISRQAVAAVVWSGENFMVSITMLVVGVFTLLNWDSTFLDRRDVLVLAPLPIRGRTLCAAKIAAAASALGLTVAACNILAGFAWPIALAPPGAGVAGTMRLVAAFWVTFLAAALFSIARFWACRRWRHNYPEGGICVSRRFCRLPRSSCFSASFSSNRHWPMPRLSGRRRTNGRWPGCRRIGSWAS